MAITEKVKAYFEGETRDLERKLQKLDGDVDRLTNEARYVKFAAGFVAAFEVFQEVAPMVVGAIQKMTTAAIEQSDHLDEIKRSQEAINNQWDRTLAIMGGGLLGNMDTLGLRLAGIAGYMRDMNDQAERAGKFTGLASKVLAFSIGGVTGLMVSGVVDKYGAKLDQSLQDRGAREQEERAREIRYEMLRGNPRPRISGSGTENDPMTSFLDPMIRGGGFDKVGQVFDEMAGSVDNVALSFDRAATAQDAWIVTMEHAKDIGLQSLQAQLTAQLRFEDLKRASGKRIVRDVLSDIGSQALAEAAYQAALAVGYLFVNPAKAASHAQSAAMLGVIAGGAALAYAGLGGSFDSSASARGGDLTGGSRTDQGGSASARTVAAATSIGTITFNLTFIYNGPAYYVGPGGLEEFVGDIVPALNDRIDSGELRAAS